MCIPLHQGSKRDRILMALAGIALSAGIALPYLLHPSGAAGKNWFEAVRGLLMGISIGLNLFMIRFARRRNLDGMPKL